ncbi:alpha/beta fold hydrolase [candidate division KSB1 bacterium]
MGSFRKYGKPPFNIVVIHGGPGLPGDVAPIANELASNFGIVEPFQTKDTIDGQVDELYRVLKNHCDYPVKLIGHSWGAWLASIFTNYYHGFVEKLVLIGAGAFEERYNKDLFKTRIDRLTPKQKNDFFQLIEQLEFYEKTMTAEHFKRLGELLLASDSFNCIESTIDIIEYQPHIFTSVWNEAKAMRKKGLLLKLGSKIQCPVVALHGDYDPHPYKGVSEPLSKVIQDFRFYLLKQCGHYPWKERFAKDEFYKLLKMSLV